MLDRSRMKTPLAAMLMMCAATLSPLAGCASDSGGELEEVTGDDVEKDDGSRLLWIQDTIQWEGRPTSVVKVFKTAEAFETYFGKSAPAEVDFDEEWAVYFAAGTMNTGGYEANILSVRLSASGRTLTIGAETVSPGSSCFVTEAFTSPATLVTIDKQGPTTTRFQTRRKSLTLACSAVCGSELPPQLEYGARGAYYPSEAEEGYAPVMLAGNASEPLTTARMLELLNRASTTNIDQYDWATWIADMTEVADDDDEYYKEIAQQHRELQQMVELHLTDVKVFDVGADDSGDGVRPLYIIGKTSCGELAGYVTTIVAT
jgi:hypothetical protein